MSNKPAIELEGVVKSFGPIRAVDGLDLTVDEGLCLGLLGPNGAGKSTTMKLLTGQAIADEGELEVLGHVLPGDSKAARAKCGVVPIPTRSPSARTSFVRPARSCAMVVHCWPPGRTYWRGSVQMGQDLGGASESGYCVPHATQM